MNNVRILTKRISTVNTILLIFSIHGPKLFSSTGKDEICTRTRMKILLFH